MTHLRHRLCEAPRFIADAELLHCASALAQAKEPKAIIKIDGMNATFQPEKIGNPNGLQITYLKDYSTRSIFVYHDSGKVLR